MFKKLKPKWQTKLNLQLKHMTETKRSTTTGILGKTKT